MVWRWRGMQSVGGLDDGDAGAWGAVGRQGCNKMTCLKCGVFFCWLCLKVIQDYSHFQVTPDVKAYDPPLRFVSFRFVLFSRPASQHQRLDDLRFIPTPCTFIQSPSLKNGLTSSGSFSPAQFGDCKGKLFPENPAPPVFDMWDAAAGGEGQEEQEDAARSTDCPECGVALTDLSSSTFACHVRH
eukprot:2429462-Rhodomonas_salina.2